MNSTTLAITTSTLDFLDETELAVYFCAQALSKCGNSMYFTADQIHYMIFKVKSKYMNEIRAALKTLVKTGYISKKSGGGYYTEYSNYTFDDEKFVMVYTKEVFDILNSNKKNKLSALQHFLYVIKSFDGRDNAMFDNRRGVIGHMPINYFAIVENRHFNTIIRLNNTLEELGLLYIRHSGLGNKANNVYGRLEDAEYIKQYARNIGGTSESYSKKANDRRSISQRYNHFLNGGGENMNKAELNQLIYDIEKYNRQMEGLSTNSADKAYYSSRIKDTAPIKEQLDKIIS